MELLRYDTLEQQGFEGYLLKEAPERVLQFGEGNFLRAFTDYFIDIANEKCGFDAKVVVVQPIENGLANMINNQQGLYTLYLRGSEHGKEVCEKRVISCVSRCINPYQEHEEYLRCAHNPHLRYIISNTTEAGIVYDANCRFEDAPATSFPAKLTRFLFERYNVFKGETGKGLVVLSCELIDNNGEELARCVEQYCKLWELPEEFSRWIQQEVLFCSTLVDRIVTGYPKQEAEQLNLENKYQDTLLDTGEIFGFWVIEGPEWLAEELPFTRAGLPVLVTQDHAPYKQRKVRILNGAHTSMSLAAYLAGMDIVRQCMQDDVIRSYMETAIQKEIIPTLTLPIKELQDFAAAVTSRFMNPFIDHSLLAIALNSTSKWKARVLPSVKGYLEKNQKLPRLLTFSFAAYIAFYKGGTLASNGMVCHRGEQEYTVQDDQFVLDLFARCKDASIPELVRQVCENEQMWGENLSLIPHFQQQVTEDLEKIESDGMKQAIATVVALAEEEA